MDRFSLKDVEYWGEKSDMVDNGESFQIVQKIKGALEGICLCMINNMKNGVTEIWARLVEVEMVSWNDIYNEESHSLERLPRYSNSSRMCVHPWL